MKRSSLAILAVGNLASFGNRCAFHTFLITIVHVHVSSTFPSQLRKIFLASGVCAGETRMMKACVLRALPDSTSDLDWTLHTAPPVSLLRCCSPTLW